ncbi:MAG: amino acid synthesis family protein [Chloroflexota bacterium]
MQLLRLCVVTDTIYEEGFRPLANPVRRVAAAAVIKNPYAGQYVEELTELIEAGAELGKLLGEAAADRLDSEPHSYGKAVIVGLNGELEHAAALMHPRLGAPLRQAVNGGKAIIPSAKKAGAAGTAIDVPLHYKDAMKVRSHFDAMEVRLPDAPRPDEIVVIIAITDGGRPHPRVGGLALSEVQGEDGLT